MSKLFTLNDAKWAKGDGQWWEQKLLAALGRYKASKVETEEDRHAKILVLAELAALGIALTAHAGEGIRLLNGPVSSKNTPLHFACIEAGAAAIQSVEHHVQRMEMSVNKALN